MFHIIHNKWLDFFQATAEIPWDTCLKSRGTPISAQQREKRSLHPILYRDESCFPCVDWRDKTTFHKHLQRRFPSAIGILEGPWVCCLKCNGYHIALNQKKAGVSCSGMNTCMSFISQDERMSESTVETLDKTLCPRLICKGGLTSLWHLEKQAEFNASKSDDTWLFLKIDRNSNITVATRKGTSVSCLT